MKSDHNYYDVLGVGEDSTPDQIKAAFRSLAFKHHPDRNLGDASAEATFKAINEAYRTLGDAANRSAYDRDLASRRAAENAARAAQTAPQDPRPRPQARATRPPAPPSPPPASLWGAVFATVLGIVGLGFATASGGADRWDSRAGRYRGSDGRFTSG